MDRQINLPLLIDEIRAQACEVIERHRADFDFADIYSYITREFDKISQESRCDNIGYTFDNLRIYGKTLKKLEKECKRIMKLIDNPDLDQAMDAIKQYKKETAYIWKKLTFTPNK